MSGVMRAVARVVAVAGDRPGRTRLAELRGQSPLLPRRTGPDEVHLVAGAAGPLGGDRLALHIEVGPGARLCVRTVAASLALPSADGAESRMEITATVATGGTLLWLPEPLIAGAGCRHTAVTSIDVAEGGRLRWRDELVCGRYGEPAGDVLLRTRVRYGGRPLYRQDLAVGPHAPGWDGPAVLGAARATGSVLLVEPAWATDPDTDPDIGPGAGPAPARGQRPALPSVAGRAGAAGPPGAMVAGPPGAVVAGPHAAAMPLAGPAVLVTAAAVDAGTVRAGLDLLTARVLGHHRPGTDPADSRRSGGERSGGAGSAGGWSGGSGGDDGVLAPLLGQVHGRVGGAHQGVGLGH